MEARADRQKPKPDLDWDPPYLILDTARFYREFYDVIWRLPVKDDMDWDLVLGESVDYLMDYGTVHGNILEYVYEIRNQVAKWYDEDVVRRLGEAVRDFAVQLFEHIEALKAYEDGAFNWAFQEFIEGDMLVYRIE